MAQGHHAVCDAAEREGPNSRLEGDDRVGPLGEGLQSRPQKQRGPGGYIQGDSIPEALPPSHAPLTHLQAGLRLWEATL